MVITIVERNTRKYHELLPSIVTNAKHIYVMTFAEFIHSIKGAE